MLTFLNRAFAQGSRSTALKPLGWLISILAVSAMGCTHFNAAGWLIATFGVFAAVAIVLYLTAYVYFALTDKDALRSERYSIQKLAIQKGFIGDDITGYIPIDTKRVAGEILELPDRKEEDRS